MGGGLGVWDRAEFAASVPQPVYGHALTGVATRAMKTRAEDVASVWCQHTVMITPRELADRHGLDMQTPLLTLSRALRCMRCGERKGQVRLEPHGYEARRQAQPGGTVGVELRLASYLPTHDLKRSGSDIIDAALTSARKFQDN